MRWYACLLFLAALVLPLCARASGSDFADAGEQATRTLLSVLYVRDGAWLECNAADCRTATSDWGVDAQTYALYLRWATSRDARIPPVLAALSAHAPRYGTPCSDAAHCQAWSDTPSWDAIALAREYEATGDQRALDGAEAAVRYVERSSPFGGGACPSILYQMPHTGASDVKSLETEANLIKAELLLYRSTHESGFLEHAERHYAAAREAYLDPDVPLYAVHVIDDGTRCAQVPRHFFASVNGDMIWNGLALAAEAHDARYAAEAMATAHAVDEHLGDGRGVFVDTGGENDVGEPLVEAMVKVAARPDGGFAGAWILRNAAAALSARAEDGTFSRFFDGPAQTRTSAWQGNGGLALEIAAAALAPHDRPDGGDAWTSARAVGAAFTTLPATVTFDGSGIALVGTLGRGCEKAHVRVFVDGVETFDRSGLWKNSSMPSAAVSTVMFAWRWPASGTHTLRLEARSDEGSEVQLQPYAIP
jgi:hypothetical protein